MANKLMFAFSLMLLSACSHNQLSQTRVGGTELLARDAESQLIVFQTPDDTEKMCLAPAPDAVKTDIEGISLAAAGENISENVGDGAAVLGGRSPLVLMSRELLYRSCEFSLNFKLNKAEALQLYERSLQTIERVSQFSKGSGSEPLNAEPVPASPSPNKEDSDD